MSNSGDWLISVDDHIIEPPEVWTSRLPAKFRDVGPRWVKTSKGEGWQLEDRLIPLGGAVTNGAIWPPSKRPPVFTALRFEEIHPACYDPKARVAAMNHDRTLAAIFFPNLPGFAGQVFAKMEDKELALLCVQAYNDWMLEEWCAADPGRFIPLVILPLWDPALAAKEVERTAAMGAKTVAFSMAPHRIGLPSIHDKDRFWDPLFSVINEAALPMCTHLGSGGGHELAKASVAADAPNPVAGVFLQLQGQETLLDWLYSGHFKRFPNLKVCLSENGIGWIPTVLETAEWLLEMGRDRVTHPIDDENEPLLDELARQRAERGVDLRAREAMAATSPKELFREHIYGCFINDAHGVRCIDEIGVDNIMIETDFPHTASWWPHSMDKAQAALAHLSPGDRYKILRGNAERVFNFKPTEPSAVSSAPLAVS